MALYCTYMLFVSLAVSFVLTEEPICTKYAVQDKLVDAAFELRHQVDTLKRELMNVQHQLNNYQLIKDIETRVNGLETKLTAEDRRIEEKLTTLTNGLPSRITSVMTRLETKLIAEDRRIEEKLIAEDKRIEVKLTTLTNGRPSRITSVMTGSTTSVAFQAFLSAIDTAFPQTSIVKFDVVPINLGKAYNPLTGIFTAPVNGTYLFSMTIGNPNGKPGSMRMKKNQKSTYLTPLQATRAAGIKVARQQ